MSQMCGAAIRGGWQCARPAGHDGEHRATFHVDEWEPPV